MELLKRVIISIIAIPGLLFLYYYGKTPLLALFCLLSALSAYELYKMNHQKGNLIIFSVIPISVLTTLFVGMFSAEWSLLLMLASLILISFEDVFKNKLEGSFDRLSASAFIMLYCGAAFGFAYKIHSLPNGNFLLPALAVLIWITDSFAYFTGMSLGKHRGFFKASPKK
jgi:phosphatidate cytidylyltransferase